MGLFHPFLQDQSVKMVGVEAAGRGLRSGHHAASICGGKVGVLHGSKSYLLQDRYGQIKETHSISAGLDYPGVGPEHSHLHDVGRIEYVSVTDRDAIEAFKLLSLEEGIIPALESSHAVAYGMKAAAGLGRKRDIIVNLSGRGDKDLGTAATVLGMDI